MADDEPITMMQLARTLHESLRLELKAVKAAPENDLQKVQRKLTPPGGHAEEVVRSIIAPDPVYSPAPRPAPAPHPAPTNDSPPAASGGSAPEERAASEAPDDRPPPKAGKKASVIWALRKLGEEGYVAPSKNELMRVVCRRLTWADRAISRTLLWRAERTLEQKKRPETIA